MAGVLQENAIEEGLTRSREYIDVLNKQILEFNQNMNAVFERFAESFRKEDWIPFICEESFRSEVSGRFIPPLSEFLSQQHIKTTARRHRKLMNTRKDRTYLKRN